MIETIILCSICFFFIFMSFLLGLHYGSKIKREERIELPNINPIKAIKKRMNEKKEEIKQEREDLIEEINLKNLDAYDGTEVGQTDFPK